MSSRYHNLSFVLLIIPISISAFTHLWNLDGFPSIYRDEDHYLRKTLHVLEGLGPQENSDELLSYPSYPYTHPYFGQLFLAAVLGAIGYPDLLQPTIDASSIKELFVVPRILMGLLAILDTFLLFKITERRYGRTTGFIASLLFASMPLTWILRRVWLEPIQLPFLLTSILLALYVKNNKGITKSCLSFIMISGIFFGLAVFTKIPVIAISPLLLYIIYSNLRNWKAIGLWIVPVLLISSSWPIFAISMNEYEQWMSSVLWQSERESMGLANALGKLFTLDPVFMLLSVIGCVYAALRKRNLFLVLWLVPFLLFNLFTGYVFYWHLIPLLPALCIGSAVLIRDASNLFTNIKIRKVSPYATVATLGVYGLIILFMLLPLNLTSFHYEVISYIATHTQNTSTPSAVDSKSNENAGRITVLGTNYWLWIPKYIFDTNGVNKYQNYFNPEDNFSNKFLLVVGENFIREMTRVNQSDNSAEKLGQLLSNSDLLTVIQENQSIIRSKSEYPFSSLIGLDPPASTKVEIRTNS